MATLQQAQLSNREAEKQRIQQAVAAEMKYARMVSRYGRASKEAVSAHREMDLAYELAGAISP